MPGRAHGGHPGGTSGPASGGKKGATRTKYVVLYAIDVPPADLPEHLPKGPEQSIVAWVPVLASKAAEGEDGQPRIVEAGGGAAAIRVVTGRGEAALEGRWKAVALASWKGGEEVKRKTDSDHLPLEEGWG